MLFTAILGFGFLGLTIVLHRLYGISVYQQSAGGGVLALIDRLHSDISSLVCVCICSYVPHIEGSDCIAVTRVLG